MILSTQAKTGEDFVIVEVLKKAADAIARSHHGWDKIDPSDLSVTTGKIEWLKQWLRSNSCPQNEMPDFLNQIKEQVFNKLTSSQIEDEYFDLLKKLSKKVFDS